MYASLHRWRKDVIDDPINLFGRSEQKKLRDTLKKISASNVSYHIQPLTSDFFDWWLPLYHERVSSKEHPVLFNVKERTLGGAVDRQYFSLTLLEGDKRLGGLIFSVKDDTLFFAYRTLALDWNQVRLRANPSLYVEYVMAEHAKSSSLKYISHGKDRNPYGLNSGIGLANFKLATGCRPQLASGYEVKVLDTDEVSRDVLVFQLPPAESPHADIKKAYLIVDSIGMEKWTSLSKYQDRLSIEVLERRGAN